MRHNIKLHKIYNLFKFDTYLLKIIILTDNNKLFIGILIIVITYCQGF